MATVASLPIPPMSPFDGKHMPMLSTIDPAFSPSSLHLQAYTSPTLHSSSQLPYGVSPASRSPQLGGMAVPMGSRFEEVPYDGPGTAIYVRQPTRAQLRENNSVFGSPNRPYYYKDPLNKPFVDADGKASGDRWIYIDPKGRKEGEPEDDSSSSKGCCIM